jgi:DNA-binding protein Alba
MMTSIVQEKSQPVSNIRIVPPSVLLIGKKHAVDYIAPGLLRLNNTGELIIKAIGSLSIVTAVDVAEMIKRDVENVLTRTISLGTDSLVISTGESKRMSCIEIRLSKAAPVPEPVAPNPIAPVEVAAPEIVQAPPAKKARAKKKTSTSSKKKKVVKKKKAAA